MIELSFFEVKLEKKKKMKRVIELSKNKCHEKIGENLHGF